MKTKAERREESARTPTPTISWDGKRQNQQGVLLGLLLDEQRRTNELLTALLERSWRG